MQIGNSIQKISTGFRINSAKDDAAGLAISKKMEAQTNGLEKGVQNAQQTQDALRTADGGISKITDSLQRIRELSVQAANGTLTGNDRTAIQKEVESLKSNISDISRNSQFNTKNLLDGSFKDVAVASQPDGSGGSVNVDNMSLEALGISDFDVTGTFDIATIDQAITKASEARSSVGAQSNGLGFGIEANQISRENTLSAKSRIDGADIAKEMSRLTQASILKQYQQQMQQIQQDNEKQKLNYIL